MPPGRLLSIKYRDAAECALRVWGDAQVELCWLVGVINCDDLAAGNNLHKAFVLSTKLYFKGHIQVISAMDQHLTSG